ncbi:MAG: prohibitin family protein [Candidatus Omnitrophica bacterium]|nr:prohibitin family protein [Candidatus Omnitrophota bacterium]
MKTYQSLLTLPLIFFGAVSLTGCAVIEDGQTGIRKTMGKIEDQPLSTGVQANIPFFAEVETWNTKVQEVKESADVPSSEGLIVQLDISLLFRIEPQNAPLVRKTIGPYYRQTVIEPYIRDAVRLVVSAYPVKATYSEEGRAKISKEVLAHLKEKLEPRGITVGDILLRDIRLPQRFKESIEAKLQAEQQALQKEFELLKAKKDAEIEIARAEGTAKAQEIIQATLSPQYLQYLWVKNLQDNQNVTYVATEANMPLFKSVEGAYKIGARPSKTGE